MPGGSQSQVKRLVSHLSSTGRALRLALPWILVAAPALGLFFLIRKYRVNIPFLDDWMFVHMFEKERAGTLMLHDYFAVQMEHRMAFVRAVIMVFHKLWPTDVTKQMFFSWGLLALTYVNVALLLKQTSMRTFRAWWPVLALSGMIIFSPVQYRIVLWAMMFQVACPAYFLTTALVALGSRMDLWLRWVVMVLCASCATQSFATGLLVWVLPLPLMIWGGAIRERGERPWFIGLWLAAFVATIGLYFTNLKNEADPAFAYKQGEEDTLRHDLSGFFSDPSRALPYVLRFLGSHLGRGTSFAVMDTSLCIGAVSLLLYMGVVAFGLRHWRREDLRCRLMPWAMLGAYSIGAGMLVALGRMWASQSGDNAISPRYVIHGVPLTVSLIVMVWMVMGDLAHRRPSVRRTASRLMQGAGVVLLCGALLTWSAGWRLMEMWHSARERGAASTLFFKVMPRMDDVVPANRDLARRADDLGLLAPPMLNNLRLDNFRLVPRMLSVNTARLRSLDLEVEDDVFRCVVRGFACLASRERVADGVFLTRRVPREGWEIFHVAQVTGMPLFLLDTLAKDTQFVHTPSANIGQEGLSGFNSTFSLDQLPPGVHDIMAWAYNAQHHTVYPMQGFFQLDTRGTRPRLKKLGNNPSSVRLDKFLKTGGGS